MPDTPETSPNTTRASQPAGATTRHVPGGSTRLRRVWLALLLAAAAGFSVLAAGMAIWIRTIEEFGHAVGTRREWDVDAYSCFVVAGVACVCWVCFFAAVGRQIAANKGSARR
ncbi:MAG TPA: hypothetical protein QGH10_23880 [Armatimonadota bacterium]|nr:hypothetical protein [Armatimonadota bacterium]